MARELSPAAQVAKLVRQWLKAEGIAASVVSHNYSMGDSVKVYLVDQAPAVVKKVKEYCAQYEYGSFNGMEDIYEYDNVNRDIPQTKYLFVNNDMSDELEQKVWDFARGYFNFLDDFPVNVKEIYNLWVPEFNAWAGTAVRQLFSGEYNNAYYAEVK